MDADSSPRAIIASVLQIPPKIYILHMNQQFTLLEKKDFNVVTSLLSDQNSWSHYFIWELKICFSSF